MILYQRSSALHVLHSIDSHTMHSFVCADALPSHPRVAISMSLQDSAPAGTGSTPRSQGEAPTGVTGSSGSEAAPLVGGFGATGTRGLLPYGGMPPPGLGGLIAALTGSGSGGGGSNWLQAGVLSGGGGGGFGGLRISSGTGGGGPYGGMMMGGGAVGLPPGGMTGPMVFWDSLTGGFGVAAPGPDGTIRMQPLGPARGGGGLMAAAAGMAMGPGGRMLNMTYEGLQELEDVK